MCGLYYNPITIVNDDARVVNKLETHLLTPLESSFTIVTCFIIQATWLYGFKMYYFKLEAFCN
jgi:hypothetical protein